MPVIGDKIYKSFGKNRVLDGVTLTLEAGKITALIGPSGSGKSTLLRSLALLELPDKGSVTIDDHQYLFGGKNPAKIYPVPWPNLTIVFQQLHLWPNMTILENIKMPLQNFADDTTCSKREQIEKLIDLFAMNDFVHRFPNEVSLGQRQRAAIARALAVSPKYLLLDEITSALDVEHVAVLLKYLRELSDRGVGILLITHLIGFAKRAADRVLFLDRGCVEEEGTSEILAKPKSERLAKFLSLLEIAS
jgi:ABC-type polar amino acid transport system ATPase subunit